MGTQAEGQGRGAGHVVHDLGLAAAHADRVAVLDAGRVAACGPPGEVLTAPLLTKVYRHDIEVIPHPRTGRHAEETVGVRPS